MVQKMIAAGGGLGVFGYICISIAKNVVNVYRKIRIIRIAVQTAVLIVLTLGIAGAGGFVGAIAQRLSAMQIIAAISCGSMLWMTFWAVATLLCGRIYCSTVCPAGTAMDIVSRIGRRSFRGPAGGYRCTVNRPIIRIGAAVVLIESMALGSATVTSWLDPAADYARLITVWGSMSLTGAAAAAVVAVVGMAFAWRGGRTLCNTICPIGGLFGLVSDLAVMRFDINPDLCTHCGKCEDVCKGRCINADRSLVDNSRCIGCFDCTAVCPDGAITWRRGRHRLQWPLMQSTVDQPQAAVPPATGDKMTATATTKSTTKTSQKCNNTSIS